MVHTRFGVSDAFSASMGRSTAGAVGGEMARVGIASLFDAAAPVGTESGAGTTAFNPGPMSRGDLIHQLDSSGILASATLDFAPAAAAAPLARVALHDVFETPPAGDLRVPDDFKLSAGGQGVLGEATGFAGHGSALFASLEGAFGNDLHMPSFVANEGFVTGPHPIVELHVIV